MKTEETIIIGAGPSGTLAAIFLAQNTSNSITVFESKKPLETLLPTGGGRCNITYYETDNRELVKHYPRGEKFLLSVFSKFDVLSTIEFFESIGINTYIQDDSRVFPTSDSSKEVACVLRYLLKKYKINIKYEKVTSIFKENNLFVVQTEKNKHYYAHNCIISTGGKGNGFDIAKKLGHTIIETKSALTALQIKNSEFYSLSGLTLKNVFIEAYLNSKKISQASGDLLFTHKSISGPAVFKTSSLNTYNDFNIHNPLVLKIKLTTKTEDELLSILDNEIKQHPHKSARNIFTRIIPKRLLELLLNNSKINIEKEIIQLSKKEKNALINSLTELTIEAVKKYPGEEIVTAGGISLDEINAKTMESKLVSNLYFCGEVINVDGFTGGFNLQNCWSTAFVCAEAIKQNPI